MKTIPIALQSHLDEAATTWCFLYHWLFKDGTERGFTSLDESIYYDPGDGEIPFLSENGMTIERLQMTADLAIDNTDLRGWVNDSGITEAQIRAGFFDHARLWVYRVNYMDLSQGHEVIAYGRAGETKFSENGWTTEFRSLTQQLKQPISELYSLTCRVKFGSPECGKSFTWVSGSVTAVGAENDRQFTDSAAADPDHKYDLGVTEWLTGSNAGAQVEIDTQIGDDFDLTFPLPYEIQVGDTYRRRIDCDKTKTTCKNVHNNLNRMRAEPEIPVQDAASAMVPGAYITTSGTGDGG